MFIIGNIILCSVSMLLAAGQLAMANYWRETDRWGAGSLIVGFVCGCLLSFTLVAFLPILFLNAILLCAACSLCTWRKATPRTFLKATLAATLGSFLLLAIPALVGLWELAELRIQYPLRPVMARLEHEQGQRRESSVQFDTVHLDSLEMDLEKETNRGSLRTLMLQKVHAGYVRHFIGSPGFGVVRMFALQNPTVSRIERNIHSSHPQPNVAEPTTPEETQASIYSRIIVDSSANERLVRVHLAGLLDFANAANWGYTRDREHVAGFLPHGMTRLPDFSKQEIEKAHWTVARLDLVGLLKYETPQVYVSEHLPKMDELADAPTRSLDGFENMALVALQDGEDLVVGHAGERLRLLGSLRAGKQCQACHNVSRGELLGAFSYTLRQEKPAR